MVGSQSSFIPSASRLWKTDATEFLLVRARGFLLDQGGEDDDVADAPLQLRRPPPSAFSVDHFELGRHFLEDFAGGDALGEAIGVRKQIALQVFGLRSPTARFRPSPGMPRRSPPRPRIPRRGNRRRFRFRSSPRRSSPGGDRRSLRTRAFQDVLDRSGQRGSWYSPALMVRGRIGQLIGKDERRMLCE